MRFQFILKSDAAAESCSHATGVVLDETEKQNVQVQKPCLESRQLMHHPYRAYLLNLGDISTSREKRSIMTRNCLRQA